MPKKIQHTTKATLISVPLPNHAATYTVISHQFVIDYAYQALANAGFGIVDEEYRCTADGQIAQGIYKLNFNNDPELSMMFAWTNSYNKQVKFKCVVGAYINNSGSVMISGEVGSWVRKHTGTADAEVKATIDDYITNAYMYYNQLCSDKASMETVSLNKRKQSQLLGVLFAEYEILTTEQASIIREQMKKPLQVFKNTDSLWAFYNFVTNALQSSHPRTWMEDQRILHYFIGTICDFSPQPQPHTPLPSLTEPVEELDPNQLNLLDAIEEAESLAVQHPVTPEEVFEPVEIKTDEDSTDLTIENIVEPVGSDFDIDKEDDDMLNNLLVPITPSNAHDVKTEEVISLEPTPEEHVQFELENTVQYADPVGNTFEAPIVDDMLSTLIDESDKEVKADLNNIETSSNDFDLDFTENNNSDEKDSDIPDFF